MKIRKITKTDRDEIYKLAMEESKIMAKFTSQPVYKVKYTKTMFDMLFKVHFGKDKYFYGIEEDGKIVAMLSGFIKPAANGKVGYIDNMFVSKRFQGKRYSSVLRDGFYIWLRKRKIKYCQLNVLAKNPALSIYEKWGFETDGMQMTKKI